MILCTVSLSKSIFVESILHHFAVFEEAFRLCSEREMKKGHRQETETTEMPDVDALGWARSRVTWTMWPAKVLLDPRVSDKDRVGRKPTGR